MPTEKSSYKPTKCVCPKCGKYHYRQMLWLGNGIPRKYCPKHQQMFKKVNTVFYDPRKYRNPSSRVAGLS